MQNIFRSQSIKLSDDMNPDMPKIMEDIQIFKAGVFSYWQPGDMTLSREVFNSMVVNFQNKCRGVDLAIDYGHNAFEEAAGWIKELYLSDDQTELWAKVDWTNKAKEKIADKQYRYISGEFSYEYEDDKGMKYGPCLFGAALTNRPFLKDMKSVIDLNEQEKIKMDEIKKLNEKVSALEINLSTKDQEISKLKNEIIEMENKSIEDKKAFQFNEMLKVGKVCEAQRESFMNNDVVKFSELAAPMNLSAKGNSSDPKNSTIELSKEDAEEKILKLAEEKTLKGMKFRDAIHEILNENPELKKARE